LLIYLLLTFLVVLSGLQFALESQVEDVIKESDKGAAILGQPSIASMTAQPQMQDTSTMKGGDETEKNRSARRMAARLGTDKDKR
jgi:hypothetical protein